ncbi:MAG: DEAD/DEAH box helicase [Verrucomicrobiota bacterium]
MIRAAFIGVDRHLDPEIPDLGGAARDARALWAIFSDSIPSISAKLCVDGDATLANVSTALDDSLAAAESDDVVIISFAGHGTPDHRLVVNDTSVGDLVATTLGMDEMAARFRDCRARAVIMLLDCCFSGGAPARVLDLGFARRGFGTSLAQVAGNGRILFAASSAEEEALEDSKTRHGIFTKSIIDYLLECEGPASMLELVAEVVRRVRATAAGRGYQQTPELFGHVEGDLSLPACTKGLEFFTAFPELRAIQTTGKFPELADFGIPDTVIAAWQERYPTGLNELQISAINKHNVLGGTSLLTVAPTSAGKTFIGEMAGIKAIADGKKAVFLLPYKALVNEKFEDFSAIYQEQLHLRIARCSGDWQDQVRDVIRGKYDIAFFTYEKFLSLSLSVPHILNQIGLVVLDEAQFITEPGRGMVVELLLTNLRNVRSKGVEPQIVTLSAVIGNVNGFERWLGCELLTTSKRPVPLIEGVMDRGGEWNYMTPSGEIGSDRILSRTAILQRGAKASSQDMIVPLVRHLIDQGEKVIVFRNSRGSAAGCAKYLADELGLPSAADAIAMLPDGDPSATSHRLRDAFGGGVAFHTSDLTREERQVVERSFRDQAGRLKVLVATSTVAAGVNTPASTVVIVETAFPGAEPQPYTVAQYKNMAGRAGRLGFETQGKAIVLADTGIERQRLFRTYVQGTPEAISSSFDASNPGTWVIRLLAQVGEIPRSSVIDLIANTYGGYLAISRDQRWREKMSIDLGYLLDRMIGQGLIKQNGDDLQLTMLGRACGESSLTLESSLRLVQVVRQSAPEQVSPLSLLPVVELLQESDSRYTPQTRWGEGKWESALVMRLGRNVAVLLRTGARDDKAYYARCKRAMIVQDWIEGVPIAEIENSFTSNFFSRVNPGDIRGFADGCRHLLESAVRIATIVSGQEIDGSNLEILLKRLEVGIPEELLDLSSLRLSLNRGELLALWNGGVSSLESASKATEEALVGLLGPRGIQMYSLLNEDTCG